MITQLDDAGTTAASSCMDFVRSMQSRYREFLAAGNVTDRRPRRESGKADRLYKEMLKRCHAGEKPRAVCEELGVNLKTFYSYCAHRRKCGDEGWSLRGKDLTGGV